MQFNGFSRRGQRVNGVDAITEIEKEGDSIRQSVDVSLTSLLSFLFVFVF